MRKHQPLQMQHLPPSSIWGDRHWTPSQGSLSKENVSWISHPRNSVQADIHIASCGNMGCRSETGMSELLTKMESQTRGKKWEETALGMKDSNVCPYPRGSEGRRPPRKDAPSWVMQWPIRSSSLQLQLSSGFQ